MDADLVIIGAGAIGCSVALHASRGGHRVVVLEKEGGVARHQSGRSSGVLHAGYNLKPGSLKAQYCAQGNKEARAFCNDQGVPLLEGGILVTARDEAERKVLAELHRRGIANGTSVRLLDGDSMRSLEPAARGIEGLHAAEAASWDAAAYVAALRREAEAAGAEFRFHGRVHGVTEADGHATARTAAGSVHGKVALLAAGLHADRLAGGVAPDLRVIPFRGYYAQLRPDKRSLVNSHVYAAPDLAFPFLGIHASRRTSGEVWLGPGAMLAFGREAYRFLSLHPGDTARMFAWPGFWRMLRDARMRELARSEVQKSLSLRAIAGEAAALLDGVRPRDLVWAGAGNRAQLVDREGRLVDDVVVRETDRCVHVLNAVSPGLTGSLPFGRDLARRALAKL